MIYNKKAETMPRQEIEELQLARLKKIIRYCYDNVAMYRKRFDENKLDPDKFRTLSDLQYIPPTTKDDMRDNYPFGLFAVPQKEIVRIHASSGTTGKPTVVGYTKKDLDTWSELMARIISAAGVTDVLVTDFSPEPSAFITDWNGLEPVSFLPPAATAKSRSC